jgi:uncharacterized protein YoaH (UPF0181 family)
MAKNSDTAAVSVDEKSMADPLIALMAQRMERAGKHDDYVAFESKLRSSGSRSRAGDIWRFIDDSVTGDGGFSDGSYLFPTKMEVDAKSGISTDKFIRRQQMADYNGFAEHICNAAWELIVSTSDMIERKAKDGHPAAAFLDKLWTDVDGRGTAILDFLEYVHGQARRYSVGFVFVDRDPVDPQTKVDDFDPKRRPYLYAVPTRNVVDWQFSDDGKKLLALVVLEPREDAKPGERSPFRVWTADAWAVFVPEPGKKKKYILDQTGPNKLGEIPVVRVYNEAPDPGKMYAATEMFNVARIAQTVYNIDSESREIERKCALFLAMPVKEIAAYDINKAVIGTDSMMLFDGDAGAPAWVSPDLDILERLEKKIDKKIDAAYGMAHLRALVAGNVIETSSGFHAEVEFSKAERRVAKHAGSLEHGEKEINRIALKYLGIDATKETDLCTVTYPRDYGVRDMQKLIEDINAVLDMNLGEAWEREELTKLAKARFPRATEDALQKFIDGAIKARTAAKQQQSAVDRVKALAAQARSAGGARAAVTAEMNAGGDNAV